MLTPGSRLGPYDIQGSLGRGGMGEVYKARDTRLRRDVAVKVLPSTFASDPDRLARFEREAQVLASLNHPHIAQIHGLEESNGIRALVMELVDGPTLADRIAQGRIPLDEALPIARQIADALEAAHEAGIIHRDLKPANIKVRPDGMVKVLDFGLAKWAEPVGAASARPPSSPTITTPAMTQAGVVLGTAAYMSPEQARGKAVDRRTDIWAFGCVWFEMLTGTRAFEGETVSDVIGGILRAEPDWSKLPRDLSPTVGRLLRRCLVKDLQARLPHIGVVRLDLSEPFDVSHQAIGEIAPARRRTWVALWIACLALAIVATTLAAWSFLRPAPTSLGLVRFELEPPPSTQFVGEGTGGIAAPEFALSPDGRSVAFVAVDENQGVPNLWLRSLASPTARLLPATANASFPFWSPDGRELGFFAGGFLKKIAVSAGPPITLCAAANGQGGTWGADGTILFAPSMNGGIWRVSSDGGQPTQVTSAAAGNTQHLWPQWIGQSDTFLYLSLGTPGRSVARLRSLRTGHDVEFIETRHRVTHASGHLFFIRDDQLFTQALSLETQAVSGAPRLITDNVAAAGGNGRAAVQVSSAGVLVFRPASSPTSRLVWRSRKTDATTEIDRGKRFGRLSLSPDGERAVVQVGNDSREVDLWMYDLTRGTSTRFTTDMGTEQAPAWSADGHYVAYNGAESVSDFRTIWIKPSGGAAAAKLVARDAGMVRDWMPDGQALVVSFNPDRPGIWEGVDLWLVPLDGSAPRPLLDATPFTESDARFSPDGRWLAYTSDENGRNDVYVQPYPPTGRKWRVSPSGGYDPNWSHGSRELYFKADSVRGDADLFAVAALDREPYFGAAQLILAGGWHRYVVSPSYDVAPDGDRFLAVVPPLVDRASSTLTVLLNWPELVPKD